MISNSNTLAQYFIDLQSYNQKIEDSRNISKTCIIFMILIIFIILISFVLQIANKMFLLTYFTHRRRAYLSMVASLFSTMGAILSIILMSNQYSENLLLKSQSENLESEIQLLNEEVGLTSPTNFEDKITQYDILIQSLLLCLSNINDRKNTINNSFNNIALCSLSEIPLFIQSFAQLLINKLTLQDIQMKMKEDQNHTEKINKLQTILKNFFISNDSLEDQLIFIYSVYNSIGFLGTPGSSLSQFTKYFLDQDPNIFNNQISKITSTINTIQKVGSGDYFSKISNILSILSDQKALTDPKTKVISVANENNQSLQIQKSIINSVGCSDLTSFSIFMLDLFKFLRSVNTDLSLSNISTTMQKNYIVRNFVYDSFAISGLSNSTMDNKLKIILLPINTIFSQIKKNNLSNDLKVLQTNIAIIQNNYLVNDLLKKSECSFIDEYRSLLINLKNSLPLFYDLSEVINYFGSLSQSYTKYLQSIKNWNFKPNDSQITPFKSIEEMKNSIINLEITNTPSKEAYNTYIDIQASLYKDSIEKFFSQLNKIVDGSNYSNININFSQNIGNLILFSSYYNVFPYTPFKKLVDICNMINSQLEYPSTEMIMINNTPLFVSLTDKINTLQSTLN